MIFILRLVTVLALVLVLFVGALAVFLPREPRDLSASFDPRKFGEGVQVYFESIEAGFDDIVPGVEKRVIWAEGAYERRTPYSVVYLHGFSASSEEIRPVPDQVAEALGANLYYTRLTGHGRDGDAMGEASVAAWMADTAEALAAGRAIGEKVIVISTSTGGTLATAAAVDPVLAENVAAMVFVSPNFKLADPAGVMLGWPGARLWTPWLLGPTTGFDPTDETHGTYWTPRYPTETLAALGALMVSVAELDLSDVQIPALFWYSEQDQGGNSQAIADRAAEGGGPARQQIVVLGEGDDPGHHVLAGDIMSPGQNEATVAGILGWLAEQGIE